MKTGFTEYTQEQVFHFNYLHLYVACVVFAKGHYVRMSVRQIDDSHLNSSRYGNILYMHDRGMSVDL